MAVTEPLASDLVAWQARVERLLTIAQSMKALAQRNHDSQLAEITAALLIVVAESSWQLQCEADSFTLTTQEYADQQGMCQRYVQRLCKAQKLPAIMAHGQWRIKGG